MCRADVYSPVARKELSQRRATCFSEIERLQVVDPRLVESIHLPVRPTKEIVSGCFRFPKSLKVQLPFCNIPHPPPTNRNISISELKHLFDNPPWMTSHSIAILETSS
ncbi:hypothetical protein PGT21_011924 [Puccinia graminis f. sp. tritici]|uniref:Uncharacterized protein n=1 Tax=Puccinia graminis f. sp. tritici TaxID=56615 RepID=A0A5B0NRF0_PUCGR|nr:hypothetical protein PGTUg99_009182 [Puccinia graminis f. sp. tritici]KAA1090730.1 hypothetical protein PGT21_011924 [Puccinia graminis f. sp. tritici]